MLVKVPQAVELSTNAVRLRAVTKRTTLFHVSRGGLAYQGVDCKY